MRRAAWVAVAGLAAVVAIYALSEAWPGPDVAAHAWVLDHLDAHERAAWRAASWPGALWVGLAVASAGGAACVLAGARREAVSIVLATSANAALVALLKMLFDRPRPVGHGLADAAFPSGHAAMAVVAYGLVALVAVPTVARRWPRWLVVRPLAIGLWLGWAGGAGAARVLAGVHWPSDVLAGWAFGLAVLALTWLACHPQPSAG